MERNDITINTLIKDEFNTLYVVTEINEISEMKYVHFTNIKTNEPFGQWLLFMGGFKIVGPYTKGAKLLWNRE